MMSRHKWLFFMLMFLIQHLLGIFFFFVLFKYSIGGLIVGIQYLNNRQQAQQPQQQSKEKLDLSTFTVFDEKVQKQNKINY